MPWERRGKTVYNKATGKSKGTSASVEMAKRHLRALYANAKPGEVRHRKKRQATDNESTYDITDDFS